MAIRFEASGEIRTDYHNLSNLCPDANNGTTFFALLVNRLTEQVKGRTKFRINQIFVLDESEQRTIEEMRDRK